ncbi:ABC transporter ATP-binding protein [Cytobacillus dafuensis]|uniref:ABC transporter ATP-binding protein n=1 Tax=Cytobacillus dafuensis TaxID=1742359 RepID=A0A5B8Z8A2_CYTDA|nr:ABC transporter ATP-binding protein [Cytobacillus dafuensis]QED49111.1 ABC transporter ATP-binding protein [Cytobacillus dafuensis]
MKVLEIKNLNVAYKNKEKQVFAVNNVSLSINEGDSVGIVGESGSGKSTLAMAILRLLPESSTEITGTIDYKGKDLLKMSTGEFNEIRWKELAVVFQKSMNGLSPIHKIGSQIEDIYRVHVPKISKQKVKEKILSLFKLVNLSERVYNLYPHELSGGMLQRVSIALSLIHQPPILILDEATTALDVVTQGQILSEIQKLEEKIKMTRIMITHDMSVVATACKKVVVMYAGKVMEVGKVQDVLLKPTHPYTQGLMKSFPSLKGEKTELRGIPGFMPNLADQNKGCIFAPRCSFAKEKCHKEVPKEIEITHGHFSACHIYGGDFN